MLSLIILNSLFTDTLHCPSVFTNGFIQLFFNVMNDDDDGDDDEDDDDDELFLRYGWPTKGV